MMEQPKNFGFGEDEAMLRDSARRFFSDNLPADRLHALVAGEFDPHRANQCKWDADLWKQVTELGWTAACVPEAEGGIGMPLVAAVALAEEAGRAGFPSPMLGTFNATFVLRACDSDAARTALSAVAEGTSMTLAVTNGRGSLNAGDTDVQVDASGRLTGSAHFVQDARKADRYLVSARGDSGVRPYHVERTADGHPAAPDVFVAPTRDQAILGFDSVSAVEVAPQGTGQAALDKALPAMLCVLSADMVGAGEWLLQTTAEYARTRVQFDRPIGFFQAIKHPLVNLMVEIDNAKSLTYNAASAVDICADDQLTLARMAKAQASSMAVYSGSRAVQFHGGIGFTWECWVQMFFKRQLHSQALLGDANHHRSHLAEVLIGPVAA